MNLSKTQTSEIKHLLKSKNKSYVIAIGGTCEGAGSTHQAILFANLCRRLGAKTAILECNDSPAFSNIERALGYEESLNPFAFKSIKFFRNVDKYKLENISEEGFDVIILDIGFKMKRFKNEFLNSDLPLIICRANDWKIDDVGVFIEENIELMTKRAKFLALYAKNTELKILRKKYSRIFFTIPFIRDPFIKDKKIEQELLTLFK